MLKTIIEVDEDKDIWTASIFINGRFRKLGSYSTFIEALNCKETADKYYAELERGEIK